MNAKQYNALYALQKRASLLSKRAAIDPETLRVIGTYGIPALGGGVLGALLYKRNRLAGSLVGALGGAGVGGLADLAYRKDLWGIQEAFRKRFDPLYASPALAKRNEELSTQAEYGTPAERKEVTELAARAQEVEDFLRGGEAPRH